MEYGLILISGRSAGQPRKRLQSEDTEHYEQPVAALLLDLRRPQGAEWVTPGLLYPVAKETVDRSLDSSGERRYRRFHRLPEIVTSRL